ncbi:MAG: polysaccharide biosynthesis protein [Bacteroidales bacterium]|nr:polysaccharide biosynthesis protein [Bacteroidales bacterium]
MKKILIYFARLVYGKRNSNSIPRWLILLFDVFIVIFSYVLLLLLRNYDHLEDIAIANSLKELLSVVIVFTISFFVTKSYKGMLRYSGFNDIVKLIYVTAISFVILSIGKFLLCHFFPSLLDFFPTYTGLLFICIFTFMTLTGSRLIIRRIYNEYLRPHARIINVIIYGAGDAGRITQNALYNDTTRQYTIKAFFDDSPKKIGKSINGVKVLNPTRLTREYIMKNNIDMMILAIPSISIKERKDIINMGVELGLNVKSIPHINTWINGELTVNQIQDVKIEDLLGREPISLSNKNVSKELKDKVVLVTGAAGSIGSEICRQVLHYAPKKLVLLDQAESPLYDLQFELKNNEPYKTLGVPMEFVIANVKDYRKMKDVFDRFKPQIVYHAAAYKHVPLMEEFPYEAVYVNVFGTKNVVDLAMEYKAEKFVMVSTDKAVNPTNVMGATKRIAEIYTQSRQSDDTKFITTRFGNVLGSNGSVIPLFKKQLEKGGPLTVTDRNIIRYFMTIPEACSLVLEAGSIGENNNIFVFDMGKPVKIYDLAKKMIMLSNMNGVEIEITGLRPGEKLYEELLATKENTIETENPKIMRAKVRQYTKEDVNAEILELGDMLDTCDGYKIVGKMKQIVPEFKSNNSIYAALDHK